MHVVRTWALIADGAWARIVENAGHDHAWVNVDGMTFDSDHRTTHDLVTDSQGRTFGTEGPARSAIEPKADPHRELKTHFAQLLADVLANALESDSYERLIIAAPPKTLGDLRKFLSDKVKHRIVGEFHHDLTKVPLAELGDHLKPIKIA